MAVPTPAGRRPQRRPGYADTQARRADMASQDRLERRFVRHPVDIPIEIVADDLHQGTLRRLKDVGLGGLACRSDRSLPIGARVVITIPLVQPPFSAPAAVVWCRRGEPHFEVGIRFTDSADLFAARMVEQVCQIEHYRREVRHREGRELDAEAAAQEWIARYADQFPSLGGRH